MIIPDINLLLYAYDGRATHHGASRRWWEDLINGAERVGVPWVVSTGFMRLITHPQVLARPATPSEAIDYVIEWFRFPHVTPLDPGPDHMTHLRRNLVAAGVGGNLVADAHIAAIAIEYQAEVHSNDTDFGRFPGLLWRNPL